MGKYTWLAWMLAAYTVSTAGDVLLKKQYTWAGALLYAACTPFWVQVLKHKDLSYIAVVSAIVGNVMVLMAASVFLGESLEPRQWGAFVLGLAAIALMG
jgi:multidrug transporter EmrE-like cation transporter